MGSTTAGFPEAYAEIMKMIRRRPGIPLHQLAVAHSNLLTWREVQSITDSLVHRRLLHKDLIMGRAHFTQTGLALSREDRILLGFLHHRSIGRILRMVRHGEPLSADKIAKLTGLNRITVIKGFQVLEATGLAECRKESRPNRFRLLTPKTTMSLIGLVMMMDHNLPSVPPREHEPLHQANDRGDPVEEPGEPWLRILKQVRRRPGMDKAQLSRTLGIEYISVRVILARMEDKGILWSKRHGRGRHYFHRHAHFDEEELVCLKNLHEPRRSIILHIVANRPGVWARDLDALIGLNSANTSYIIKQMMNDGLLISERSGKNRGLFLSNAEMVTRMMKLVPPQADTRHEDARSRRPAGRLLQQHMEALEILIEKRPGLTRSQCVMDLHTTPSQTERAISRLDAEGRVWSRWITGHRHYFPNLLAQDSPDVTLIVRLNNTVAIEILAAAIREPGMNMGRLEQALQMNHTTLRTHLKRLTGDGLTRIEHDRGRKRVYVKEPARIEQVMKLYNLKENRKLMHPKRNARSAGGA